MTTERQRKANQRNGRLSRVATGKARSRTNALKHGFSAKVLGDPGDVQHIEEVIRGIARSAPLDVARELAASEASLRQIRQYQNRLLSMMEAKTNLSSDAGPALAGNEKTPSLETKIVQANAAGEDLKGADDISCTLDNLLKSQRYERHALARVRRALRRTVES
jgi:hypothetical protein